jgi:hypothetical protein
VQFLESAKAPPEETPDHLIEAKTRELIDARLFSRLWNLSKAAERAATNLLLSNLRREKRNGRNAVPILPAGAPVASGRVREPHEKDLRLVSRTLQRQHQSTFGQPHALSAQPQHPTA